jgi:para-aminobenzoate synthetase component 1
MDFTTKINSYAKKREPFFFAIDFEQQEYILEDSKVLFQIKNFKNFTPKKPLHVELKNKLHVEFKTYQKAIKKIKEEIKKGNTYLLNFTCKTKLDNNLNLKDIFYSSDAPFKLYVKDRFVCFSPERFVKIEDNKISTYPMKGTIDAKIKNAKEKILSDKKEMSEHTMVVDLLRNDLGIVAKNIRVEKFRYVEKIKAGEKELLQVSSKITGDLDENWHEKLGDILKAMLPAGSISGTPKKKTVEIIKRVENYKRGFFTGVFGYYDGKSLDSAVMIRFIEKTKDGYIYKSGGGITIDSDEVSEYEEMKDKVYLPLKESFNA